MVNTGITGVQVEFNLPEMIAIRGFCDEANIILEESTTKSFRDTIDNLRNMLKKSITLLNKISEGNDISLEQAIKDLFTDDKPVVTEPPAKGIRMIPDDAQHIMKE